MRSCSWQHGHRSFTDGVAAVGEDREADGTARLVLEQPVAVGVPEAERGEPRARGGGVVREARQIRDVPGLVPLGDRPVCRHGGAEIDGADDRVAIDRVRDAPAELERLQPRAPRIVRLGRRVQVDPEHGGIEADAGVGESTRPWSSRRFSEA